ncbi:MAG: hypothetical protein PUH24_07270 [Prevotellaceae bacterium]|nr:hypothetical protein [Prevotella sp.]MDD7258047.1 hypothetical protein [Prevotellaceae bacterium]
MMHSNTIAWKNNIWMKGMRGYAPGEKPTSKLLKAKGIVHLRIAVMPEAMSIYFKY